MGGLTNRQRRPWAARTWRAACAAVLVVFSGGAAPGATAGGKGVKLDLPAEWNKRFDELRQQVRNRSWFERVAKQTFRRDASILPADRDATDVLLRRTKALLAHVADLDGAPDLKAPSAALAKLDAACKATAVSDTAGRKALFMKIIALRRQISLSNPLVDFDKIMFVKSHRSRANHCCDQYFGFNARPGGSVYVLSDPFGDRPTLRDVLADSVVRNGRLKGKKLDTGSFRSPDLSYDAKTMLFAYTQCGDSRERWSPEKSFHVFKVNADGTGLVQLTDGTWNDFDPCWLPNGRIVFISERRGGFGRCHPRPVPTYTLHSMNADGSDIVALSYHETNEWHPSVNNDGMIVYTRWDYIDRGDCIAHHPWITYPDGRDPRAIHGNYPTNRNRRPDQETDIRAIPGSARYVATASPHHGQAYGSLVVFDPRVEDDGAMAPVKRLTPETPFPETERGRSIDYGTAWPLSEDFYLCVKVPAGREPAGVYLIDSFGNRELIYSDPSLPCLGPIPLRPRPTPPVIPHQTAVGLPGGKPDPNAPTTGTIACMNVYNSAKPWPEGTKIKELRVIQLFPKSTVPVNQPDLGIASESLARGVLGTAPVEADGSVHFIAPAGKVLYFQALDENGCAVQSMQSETYVHPGENLTCQGCHEKRRGAPVRPTKMPLALRRAPSKLTPEAEGSWPLLYPRLVQPVLDAKCVPCHTKNAKKAPDLTGEPATWRRPGYGGGNKLWSKSYISLVTPGFREGDPIKGYAFGFSGRPPGRTPTETVPGEFGARASKLYKMLKAGHKGVKLTPEEIRRITLWLDCNSLFYGAARDLDKQVTGQVVIPALQ